MGREDRRVDRWRRETELIRLSTSGRYAVRANAPVTCHACFLILYTVTVRFPWECSESVPRIDQGFTLPIAATRERSDRPSLSLVSLVSRLFPLSPILPIVD